jgi:NAD(P)-dependent dehydrogenase (short-subunit alcohol dehydrogenase family)
VPARVIVADLQDPRQAERMVDECVGHFGRLDALVNNAGWSPSATIAQTTAAIAERVFLVNAVAPTVAIARAWPIFERQARASGRPGVVVNVSSMAAVAEPYPILYAYAAAKAAVVSLARSVALQGAGIGVKGFAVAPGAVETPLLRTLVDEATLPRSKTLRPEDVASVIVDSVVGRRDRENGGVIALPSPG